MFRYVTISIFLLTTVFVQAQEIGPIVIITKDTLARKDGVYQVVIENRSDSVLWILRSMTVTLTASQPQVLAMQNKDRDIEDFSLQYSADDTSRIYEAEPYLAEIVLPGQSLEFKVNPLFFDAQKPAQLSFEYIYRHDFCYREFLEEMKKVSSWYRKYGLYAKIVKIPAH